MHTKDPVSWRLGYGSSLVSEVIERGILGLRTCLSGETEFPSLSALRWHCSKLKSGTLWSNGLSREHGEGFDRLKV